MEPKPRGRKRNLEASDRGGGTRATLLARFWEPCRDPDMRVPEGVPLFVAMDPSSGLDDPFAVVTVTVADGHYYCWCRRYLLRNAFERAPKALRAVYDAALATGELVLAESTGAMEAGVLDYCSTLSKNTSAKFGGDARGLSGWRQRFESRIGPYEPVSQGWELTAALEQASGLAFDRRLHHGGQPLLTSNVNNLVVESGRMKKYDATSSGMGSAKIDGAMALLSAVQLAETSPAFDADCIIG